MKAETFTPKAGRPTHGYTGPIQICVGQDLGVGKQFLDVGKVYDPHRPQVDDNNDFETANAYSVSIPSSTSSRHNARNVDLLHYPIQPWYK